MQLTRKLRFFFIKKHCILFFIGYQNMLVFFCGYKKHLQLRKRNNKKWTKLHIGYKI